MSMSMSMSTPTSSSDSESVLACESDHLLASDLATRAGQLLVSLRQQLNAEHAPAAVIKAEGDAAAEKFIAQELVAARPDDGVLSEEAIDDRRRLSFERVWVIDPLDGTREFSEAGRTDWAVHVALAINGRPCVGAVALPAAAQTFTTAEPTQLLSMSSDRLRIVVSRSRPPEQARSVAHALDAELVPLGSAGAKTMAVVRGDAEVYLHSGGQYEWDSCAPVAVALASGFAASRLDGRDLLYNQPNPYLPDLVVCRPELHASVLAAL